MRACDEVGILDLEVVDRNNWQAAPHAYPGLSVIGAEVDACFRADEQQSSLTPIGSYHAGDLVARQIAGDGTPGASAVGRAEQVRLIIGKFVARGRYVNGLRVMRRNFDAADIGQLWHCGWRHILPRGAIVARDVYQAV